MMNNNKRNSNEIHHKEFEDPNFQFLDKSIFNQTQALKEIHKPNQTLSFSQSKSKLKDMKNNSLDSYRSKSVKSKNSRYKKGINNSQSKGVSLNWILIVKGEE